MAWDDEFRRFLCDLAAHKPVVACGDFNVAHQEIDLKNPGPNRGNAGSLRRGARQVHRPAGRRLHRHLSPGAPPRDGRLQLVELPLQRPGQQRRLAHRLLPGEQQRGRPRLPTRASSTTSTAATTAPSSSTSSYRPQEPTVRARGRGPPRPLSPLKARSSHVDRPHHLSSDRRPARPRARVRAGLHRAHRPRLRIGPRRRPPSANPPSTCTCAAAATSSRTSRASRCPTPKA